MKRLNIAFFNAAALLLVNAQRSGISVFGTITDDNLPANTAHWFNSSVVVPTVDEQAMGKLLNAVDAMEFDDGVVGAISSICVSQERDQVRLKATVVRYGPLTSEQLRKLVVSDTRDYFNEWSTKDEGKNV